MPTSEIYLMRDLAPDLTTAVFIFSCVQAFLLQARNAVDTWLAGSGAAVSEEDACRLRHLAAGMLCVFLLACACVSRQSTSPPPTSAPASPKAAEQAGMQSCRQHCAADFAATLEGLVQDGCAVCLGRTCKDGCISCTHRVESHGTCSVPLPDGGKAEHSQATFVLSHALECPGFCGADGTVNPAFVTADLRCYADFQHSCGGDAPAVDRLSMGLDIEVDPAGSRESVLWPGHRVMLIAFGSWVTRSSCCCACAEWHYMTAWSEARHAEVRVAAETMDERHSMSASTVASSAAGKPWSAYGGRSKHARLPCDDDLRPEAAGMLMCSSIDGGRGGHPPDAQFTTTQLGIAQMLFQHQVMVLFPVATAGARPRAAGTAAGFARRADSAFRHLPLLPSGSRACAADDDRCPEGERQQAAPVIVRCGSAAGRLGDMDPCGRAARGGTLRPETSSRHSAWAATEDSA